MLTIEFAFSLVSDNKLKVCFVCLKTYQEILCFAKRYCPKFLDIIFKFLSEPDSQGLIDHKWS